ncbi:MAG: UvrD-helicase domain-containing protein [Ignavibacteriae bacterium]|nr:UvrD-helicase domain-containing protein [Ignavibacteria bacterium]MBI3364661.1 UvrD-helicase domain-containing protein [Ignavibacteriota bacterium]
MLTEHQQKALDFEHHLSVTANAGAGKTTVLVQRFVDILLKTGIPVKQLVAITFTEKAASELRKKVAEHIEQKIRNPITSGERYALEYIRDQLSSANIGTIHSFCAQLLREFPVEADVDAAFIVLEGVDQQFLEQEAMRETIESILRKPEEPVERDEALEVIRMLGQRTVQSYLAEFLRKHEHVDRLLQDDGWFSERKRDDEILEFWGKSVRELVVAALDDPRWIDSAQNILSVAAGKSAGQASALLGQWKSVLPYNEKVRLYQELRSLVFTQKGTLRRDLVGSKTDVSSIRKDEHVLSQHLKSIEFFLSAGDGENSSNQILLRVLRNLLKLYKKIVDRYTLKKYQSGQLDFDDLQLRTRELLQHAQIRERLAGKYSYIMVDEYQDTNQLQYDVLRLLTSNIQKGNLFIVGDPKQSIYGFRNAEVEIFEATRKDIVKANADWQHGNIALAESFRLLPALVDFVNRVFSQTMGSANSGFEVCYDELIKGRTNSSEGRVEFLLISSANKEEAREADAVSVECRSIARRIVELVDAGCEVFGTKNEQAHPFQFKDAAILLRGRSHLRKLEKALVECGVPYQLSGGIGFYQTQEVFDFLNYFSFLLNRDDDVALVGVLRSPFFVVSDAELFGVSLISGSESLWEKMKRYVKRSEASVGVQRAVNTLQEDLAIANRLPIPFLVQRIFHQTGWHGTVAGLTFGIQHSANIQKLLRIAREFEGKGFLSLYDFVERLRTLATHEEREGQATVEPSGNCVQIMTIHAAKGLEFPVVFLPFTHQEFRYDAAPYIDHELGIAFKVKDETDYNQEIVPPFFHFLRRRKRAKTEAEEKRIFYVGCTRARDILVLSGNYDPDSSHSCYLRWTLEGLGLGTGFLTPGPLTLPPVRMKILDQKDHRLTLMEIQHSLEINILLADEHAHAPAFNEKGKHEDVPNRKTCIEPLTTQPRGEFFSATQIRTYMECPAKYYLKYCLGLPEQNAVPYSFDEEEDANDAIRGELLGSITHGILEEIETSAIDRQELRQRIERRIAVQSVIPEHEKKKYVEATVRNVFGFLDSEFGRRALSSHETKLEYSLSLAFENDFLVGTIDRLYRGLDSQWCIIDYKTDTISLEEIHRRAEIYKQQIAVYAILVSRLYRQSTVPASIVFLRHPDSPIHFLYTSSDLNMFEGMIRRMIHSIRENRFEPKEEPACATCSYQSGGQCILYNQYLSI